MSLELSSKYVLFENYIGVSKICCPLCDQLLSNLGYFYRGTHGYIKPAIAQWKVPYELDLDCQSRLFSFLKEYLKNLNIDKIDNLLVNQNQTQIKPNSNNRLIQEISKTDKYLFCKKFQATDSIIQFKNKKKIQQQNKLNLYEFEWIFDTHMFLKSIIEAVD